MNIKNYLISQQLIRAYPENEKQALKKHIEQFKATREFYKNASMRILHDTDNLTVIEYADADFNKIEIQIFTNIVKQSAVTVYPILNTYCKYICDGEAWNGCELAQNGIEAKISDINCKKIVLIRKD